MRRIIPLVLLSFFCTSGAAGVQTQASTRTKRVAILDFDYSTVRTSTAALFGTDIDVGRGVSDMLVTSLVNDGTYSVIERALLDQVLAEQDFSNSARADSSSAAQIGSCGDHAGCRWRGRCSYQSMEHHPGSARSSDRIRHREGLPGWVART